MGIQFVGPEEVLQPPESVRFLNVFVQSYRDGRRVKIKMEVTPFLQPPDIEIEAYGPSGDRMATASIIEVGSKDLEITLHLRGEISPGEYLCKLWLGYREQETVDYREVAFSVFEADNHDEE